MDINYLNESGEENREVAKFLEDHWGSVNIVSRGKMTDASKLPRIIARDENSKIAGLITYAPDINSGTCEIVSVDAVMQGMSIGSELLKHVEEEVKTSGIKKVWLITTNDNMEAANFYLKNGYKLKRVHLNALEESRKLKPQIPKIGEYGIPLLHELEFEKDI